MARKANARDSRKKRSVQIPSTAKIAKVDPRAIKELQVDFERRIKQLRLEVDRKLDVLRDQVSAQIDGLIVGKADRITLAAILAEMSKRLQDKNGS
jgi:hypothetical protein